MAVVTLSDRISPASVGVRKPLFAASSLLDRRRFQVATPSERPKSRRGQMAFALYGQARIRSRRVVVFLVLSYRDSQRVAPSVSAGHPARAVLHEVVGEVAGSGSQSGGTDRSGGWTGVVAK